MGIEMIVDVEGQAIWFENVEMLWELLGEDARGFFDGLHKFHGLVRDGEIVIRVTE